MAVERDELDALMGQINKKHGAGSLFMLGENTTDIPRVSTGLSELDAIMNGGIPVGRIIELYGAEQSGKTSLAYRIAAQFEKVLFIDAEGTIDAELAKIHGIKPKQVIVRQPQWAEEALDVMTRFAEEGVPLIILDSVAALQLRSEFEERDMEKAGRVGGTAGLWSRKIGRLGVLGNKNGTTILLLNQLRDVIGAMPFAEQTSTPGGRAIKHACSLRIQMARKGWHKDPKINDNSPYGQISKCLVTKSKVGPPRRECELDLVFERGWVAHENLLQVRKELRENAPAPPSESAE